MKSSTIFACSVAVAICAALPCFAADSPWDGTWKLNRDKSQLAGDTWIITQQPDGHFRGSNASGSFTMSYGCDGKEYPVITGYTTSCKKVSDTVYEYVSRKDGKVTSTDHSVLSGGYKIMTDTVKNFRPDGTTSVSVTRYERVGAGTGPVGTWKDVKTADNMPSIAIIKLTGDTMRSESPAYKSVTTARLDGSPAKMEGPTASPDVSVQMKAEGPQKIHYVVKLKGKLVAEGMQTLSADGKTMTEEEWDPAKPDERQTYVYEKQ